MQLEMLGEKRRWRLICGLAVVAVLLPLGAWEWWEARHYRRAMSLVEEQIDQGLHALAAHGLADLMERHPGSDEVAFWLGDCEKMRGRAQAATAAWDRIPPTSSFWPRATEGRMELELERGRPAAAEELIQQALANPRADRSDASILLGPIYCHEGRLDEAKRLVEKRWQSLKATGEQVSEKGISVLRLYTEIESKEIPIEETRAFLDQAASSAPDDDRVWLGKANLATRMGRYDEAARLLRDCLRQRPEDVSVCALAWSGAWPQMTSRPCVKPLGISPPTLPRPPRSSAWRVGLPPGVAIPSWSGAPSSG